MKHVHSMPDRPAFGEPSGAPGVQRWMVIGKSALPEVAKSKTTEALSTRFAEDVFSALAGLKQNETEESYSAVLACSDVIQDRPESAARALKRAAPSARLIVLSTPQHEPMSRKLRQAGVVDDYLIMPVGGGDLERSMAQHSAPKTALQSGVPAQARPATHTQHSPAVLPVDPVATPEYVATETHTHSSPVAAELQAGANDVQVRPLGVGPLGVGSMDMADWVLSSLLEHPADPVRHALGKLSKTLPAGSGLELIELSKPLPAGYATQPMTMVPLVLPVQPGDKPGNAAEYAVAMTLGNATRAQADSMLAGVVPTITKLLALHQRHKQLQKLAITDDLTGLFNARYFNHFLAKITARARQTRTPVSLLIFDIDNFKKYNDQFGHTAGDEILKAVGQMMKRCVRDHDLVARLGGDEFVVVFWDNGASRPKNAAANPHDQAQMIERAGKPLSDPVQIFNRCKKLLSEHQFKSLGPNAKGQLTLSGGLAVFPYDADTPETLLQAADHCLMAASKKNGKNTLTLVGQDQGV